MYNRLDQPRITPQRTRPAASSLKNYITPARFKRLKDEALHLLDTARS
jgi:hypothetical protein